MSPIFHTFCVQLPLEQSELELHAAPFEQRPTVLFLHIGRHEVYGGVVQSEFWEQAWELKAVPLAQYLMSVPLI